MTKIIILFALWASGVWPSYRWLRRNTDLSKASCALMAVGSWGILVCWIANVVYNWFIGKRNEDRQE